VSASSVAPAAFDIRATCSIIATVCAQADGATPSRSKLLSATWAVLAATVLLGAWLRFYRLGTWPPGLYHDEAFNGLDALRVLEGERPIFFEANNGREPFFLYCIALAVAWLGRTPYAVRVMAAALGTLTIPVTFLMARALFGERAGLWSAWLVAVAPWPINLSRVGLRAVSMPPLVALGVWLWWTGRGQKAGRRRWYLVLGGVFLGLSLYTYTAARLIPVAVALFALFQVLARSERRHRDEFLYLALAAVLVMVPLLAYGITHWDTFAGRPGQVSIVSPDVNHGNLLGMLSGNVAQAVGLFTFRGDSIPRHNVPLRPVFDPLISVFFVVGVLLSLVGARKGGAHALALVWVAVMLVPTILAEDCPHFLRAVGVLPMAMVFPALGLEWTASHLRRRVPPWAIELVIATILLASAAWGILGYYRHVTSPDLGYAFEVAQVEEAAEINRFLGTGWQGQGVRESKGDPIPGRHVYLGPRMWEDRQSVNFLVALPERVSIAGRDPVVEADAVLALLWPYGDMSDVRQLLPYPAEIDAWRGPLEQGDLDAEPRTLYIAFRGTRLGQEQANIAQFEEGIQLLEWSALAEGSAQTRVHLRWRATQPVATSYTAFVHLVQDGRVVGQADGVPGGGFLPTVRWSPGDEVIDEHVIDEPYRPGQQEIVVGWYELGSMRHLRVLSEDEQPGADRLILR
jgi:4-amino-4-deoxy-L-arabinose transferase-like glycosyltransferase